MSNQKKHSTELDFDQWSGLAESNQSEFETLRRAAIDEFINAAPEDRRERLMRLQWRIDQERCLSGSALGACIRISKLMWEQLTTERDLLGALNSARGASELVKADVIPLVRE